MSFKFSKGSLQKRKIPTKNLLLMEENEIKKNAIRVHV